MSTQSAKRTFIAREDATAPFFIGVDLGGTGVKIGLVDDNGKTLAFESIPTNVDEGGENCAARIGQTVKRLIEKAGLHHGDIAGVGLGAPGPIVKEAVVCRNVSNSSRKLSKVYMVPRGKIGHRLFRTFCSGCF